MTGAYAIEAQGITRRYGDVQALAGVDVTVEPGEVFAVLGPNGAGKTTLVEILEGLRIRDAGIVQVLGSDPATADRQWRARIGAVLQVGTQTDELTVGEMVGAYAAYYPNPHDIAELLEALDLTQLRDRRIQGLSGGQKRRLDVALGLIGNPELLFLDEPTTGLDPEVRIRIWEFVKGLSDRGMTILLTTHYMEEAEKLADRVAVLVAGKIVATGAPTEIIGASRSKVSFRLTGSLVGLALPSHLDAVDLQNDLIAVVTDDPAETVTQLVNWANQAGESLEDLNVEQRGLEQAYLDLLREELTV